MLIGLAGIGIAFFQWWYSDKAAMRAMRAREVTPEEAPAVMIPGAPSTLPNTGGSFRSVSIVVSPRGCSSRSMTAGFGPA